MIIKFIIWLGRCLLKLLRLLFLNKAARQAIDGKPPAKPKMEIAEKPLEGKSRKALIAEAVFLHRAQRRVGLLARGQARAPCAARAMRRCGAARQSEWSLSCNQR